MIQIMCLIVGNALGGGGKKSKSFFSGMFVSFESVVG
jgi:hypothetical protein